MKKLLAIFTALVLAQPAIAQEVPGPESYSDVRDRVVAPPNSPGSSRLIDSSSFTPPVGPVDLLQDVFVDAGILKVRATGRPSLTLTDEAGLAILLPPATWRLAGFTYSGGIVKSSFVWRGPNNQIAVWDFNPATGRRVAQRILTQAVPAVWELVTISRTTVRTDSAYDLETWFWRNKSTGENVAWLMNAHQKLFNQAALPTVPLSWVLVGAGNLYGTGLKDSLLWRNLETGENAVWQVSGTSLSDQCSLLTVPSPDWAVTGIGRLVPGSSIAEDVQWAGPDNQFWNWSQMTACSYDPIPGNYVTSSPNPGLGTPGQ
jgi:hypothetical protein